MASPDPRRMPGNIYQQYLRDPRLALAMQLQQQGADVSPVKHWAQGLARLGAGFLGGQDRATVEKEYGKRGDEYQQTLARALSGQESMTQTPQVEPTGELMAGVPRTQTTPPTLESMGRILMGNPDLADTGLGLLTKGIETEGARKYQTGERVASQGFQAGQADVGRQFQREERAAGQEFQAGQAGASREHQMTLQKMQQAFQAQQGQLTRDQQAALQRQSQEFTAQQNALNRELDQRMKEFDRAATLGKMNDEQAKAAGFADRIISASQVFDVLGQKNYVPGVIERNTAGAPVVGNLLASSDYQQYDQASRNFINAVLRRESGAVISEPEFDNAYKQYLPRAGDRPEVIEQKRRNREEVLQGMMRSAGPAYKPPASALTGRPTDVQGPPLPAGGLPPLPPGFKMIGP